MNVIKFLSRHSVALLLVCAVSVATSALAQEVDQKSLQRGAVKNVTVKKAARGIPAELIDEGDYYLHPDGRRLSFYRKKDVYAVVKSPSSRNRKSVSTKDRFKAQYGEQVEFVKHHALGNTEIVRINNRTKAKAKGKRAFDVTPEMLKSLDSSIVKMEPVLANAKGSGDLLVTSDLIVKLDASVDPNIALNQLAARFKLSLVRKLNAPGNMFVMRSGSLPNISAKFALVRRVMNDSRVAWAQPQFKARPFKTTFEPNDSLFSEQWNLRNTGKGGSRCDTDCDANNAWDIGNANGVGAVSGSGTIIAIIDDGVQLNHEDLDIWNNSGEVGGGKEFNGLDDDGNGYIDDYRGWDFVDDDSSAAGSCGEDATRGVDNNPNPQDFTGCTTVNGDLIEEDDHGTAVAGIAAATGNNSLGVAGTAYSASILPIRLISAYDMDQNVDFCARVVEAMAYAGTYADVINNSWGVVESTCPALDTIIDPIVDGTLADLNGVVVPRRDGKGSPVVFAAGNAASGWMKVTVPVTSAGEHAYEWRFARTAFPSGYNDGTEDNAAWLDDIEFPDGSTEDFETNLGDFTNQCADNTCDVDCLPENPSSCPVWTLNTDPNYSRSGQSALIDLVGDSNYCTYSYLHTIKDGPAGEISFWVWVSTDQQVGSDKFEFLVDGVQKISFGDLPRFVDNEVGYPASLTKTIAVGASDAGQLSGTTSADLASEERSFYSQFGSELDVLAPSDNQHLGIVTTDRYGATGEGYNATRDIGGTTSSAADPRYTDDFGGTSAAAPLVAGVAAAMIAADPMITAASVESTLRATADKIGRRGAAAYDQVGNTRSEFYGYGRVNMFAALKSVLGASDADSMSCTPEAFSYSRVTDLILPSFPALPQFDSPSCPAKGPLVPDDSTCFVVKTLNGNAVVFCL